MKKIITRLFGGLGNQFFQYAAGRALAARHGAELILDNSLLKRRRWGVTYREYALDAYHVRGRKASALENKIIQRRVFRPFDFLCNRGLMRSSYVYYREPHYEYDPGLFQIVDNAIIEGYWQSERYFRDVADEIRDEFQPVAPLLPLAQECLAQIQQQNSVSVHVRRGDYISKTGAAVYETCDAQYYQRAIDFVAKRVSKPVLFVFSDAPDWVKENLKSDYPMVVVSRLHSWPVYDDLRLMSLCRHNIIANSSFSWWGAWLNANPDKIVVAPSRWFKNGYNTCDLIPLEWNII
ncbi:MAG TPA: alpha-1,2-fucosyltransferase [Candidatus Omnitrophota bacterium]|nr:alpha-1,2-fucosyltransferase [Candidatus Omnitrophota bacterium]HPS36511.1 alpha-1,2-fucosyltransferase [Candidatus Omnitrophota bacterium]